MRTIFEKFADGIPLSTDERNQFLLWADRQTEQQTPEETAALTLDMLFSRGTAGKQLSDITRHAGILQSGEFRVGNDNAPGDGFTGGRFGYPGFDYGGTEYFFVGVEDDVLQVGLSLTDGKIYFGAGSGWLDGTGQHLDASTYPSSAFIDWLADDTGVTIGKLVGSYGGALTNSGLLIYGQAKSSSVKGLVYLAANNESGTTKSSFVLDTSGVMTADMRSGTNTALNTQGMNLKTKVADNNDINNTLYLDSESTGTPTAGFGTAISFRAENAGHSLIDMGYVGYAWTTATAGSESSRAVFGIKDGGSAVEGLQVTKSGVKTPIGLSVTGGFFNLPVISDLTISGGVVTATGSHHRVDTQGGAATDDLDTINGGTTGDILIIRTVAGTKDVTAKDGTGNLLLNGDFLMDTVQDMLVLMKVGSSWQEISRSSNL